MTTRSGLDDLDMAERLRIVGNVSAWITIAVGALWIAVTSTDIFNYSKKALENLTTVSLSFTSLIIATGILYMSHHTYLEYAHAALHPTLCPYWGPGKHAPVFEGLSFREDDDRDGGDDDDGQRLPNHTHNRAA